METVLKYRNREVNVEDVAFIKKLIAEYPNGTRRLLSVKLCEAWNWRQSNGRLCDSTCRSLMLLLHRAGHIELPSPQWTFKQPRRLAVVERIEVPQIPLAAPLKHIGPLEIRQVRYSAEETLVKSLIADHHYLGYMHPVGEQLKYLVLAKDQPVACMCLSSAARHLGPRDRYIGWSQEARKENIRFIAYQSRFLILPWVRVPHLASHLLGCISRRLSADWERVFAHPIYYTETFVDPTRFRGTSYLAANWTVLGLTTGRGKNDQTMKPNRSLKQVLGYPLIKDFRRRLCTIAPKD
jgi:hypothetical protein